MRYSRDVRVSTLVLALITLNGCAATQGAARSELPDGPPFTPHEVGGAVHYESRWATGAGLSSQVRPMPAIGVAVEARAADGRLVAASQVDANGAFSLRIDAPAATLEFVARVRTDAFDVRCTTDAGGQTPHRYRLPWPGPREALAVLIPDMTAESPAGAFHIVDTARRGLIAANEWSGERLPPVFFYWARGITHNWSYYRGEVPEGSGEYGLELMGGEPGRRAVSDTDDHDDVIILHELGHFVMDVLGSDSSTGGSHGGGVLLDPGLVWEEGRASYFAAAVLRAPRYLDSIGLAPTGGLRVAEDLERQSPGPRGNGSEAGTAELLWDLVDGSPGYADRDGDGVALTPAQVLRAMNAMAEVPGAMPCLATFVRFLVDRGDVPEDAMRRLMAIGGQPADLLPAPGVVPWPLALTLGAPIKGEIDARTEPAPSGGGPNVDGNGIDAVRTYRFEVPSDGLLRVRLSIEGSGRADDGTDLDIELRDIRATPIAASTGLASYEAIERTVEAGWYTVYVRDGSGNGRARFTLEVTHVPAPRTP